MTQPDIFDEGAPWAERLPELRLVLEAYASVPREERFTDTAGTPSKAMRSYLRMATYYPGRAFRATAEILTVLKQGLDAPDVASDLASMPPIIPPPGRTREDCLRLTAPHLVAFTERGERAEPAVPETRWEWRGGGAAPRPPPRPLPPRARAPHPPPGGSGGGAVVFGVGARGGERTP